MSSRTLEINNWNGVVYEQLMSANHWGWGYGPAIWNGARCGGASAPW